VGLSTLLPHLIFDPYLHLQTLTTEATKIYGTWRKPSGAMTPWGEPTIGRRGCVDNTKREQSLFGRHYMTVTLDEGHAFQTLGAKQSSGALIMSLAFLQFVLTATPIQTSTKVIMYETDDLKLTLFSGRCCNWATAWDQVLPQRQGL